MRFVATGMAAATLLGLAACTSNANRPTDVGNMAFPAPVPAGNVSTTTTTTARRPGADTGSMAEPSPRGGVVTRESVQPDTGNMALPNSAQGNAGTTRR